MKTRGTHWYRTRTTVAALTAAVSLLAASPRDARAQCGSGYGFILMPASGYLTIGWMSQSTDARRWGTPELVYGLMDSFYEWAPQIKPGGTGRFMVGELSQETGGDIGHKSHRCGIDADVGYLRRNPYQNWAYYNSDSYYLPQETLWFLAVTAPRHLAWDQIFFDDSNLWRASPKIGPAEQPPVNHHNHWHGRILRPPAVANCCNHSGCP